MCNVHAQLLSQTPGHVASALSNFSGKELWQAHQLRLLDERGSMRAHVVHDGHGCRAPEGRLALARDQQRVHERLLQDSLGLYITARPGCSIARALGSQFEEQKLGRRASKALQKQ